MTNKRQREIDDGSVPEQAKKPKLAKVFDGTYFTIVEHDEIKKNISAKCTNCVIKENIIRGSSSSTGNFFKHYFKIHPDKHNEMKIYCDEKAEHRKFAAETKTKIQPVLPFSNMLDPKKVSRVITIFFTKNKCFLKINFHCYEKFLIQ